MIRRGAIGLGVAALALAAAVALRIARLESRQPEVDPIAPMAIDEEALAERLAGALRIPTLSHQDPERFDANAFAAFRRYLERTWPRSHAALTRETISEHTLLYRWAGRDASLPPLLLLAHQDVVPVEPGSESRWEAPPFSGALRDGFVHGRGALDDKGSLVAILEAVESLVARGFAPARDVLLTFGHDEELGGPAGAAAVAERLAERGIEPALVLDEGGSILAGVVPGIPGPTALVGIAEKGYVSVELLARGEGGHSSTPPANNAIAILAAALARLEAKPLPLRVAPPVRALFAAAAPEAQLPHRLVYANFWLFEPLVVRALGGAPRTAALVRTTCAPTLLSAGIKDNVVPSRASAVVNFRILPGDSIESVLRHVRDAIDDERVRAEPLPKRREPSPASSLESPQYALLARTIREVFPGTAVLPYLVVAGTDSRHFRPLSEAVYRFMPIPLEPDDLRRIHGTGERVRIAHLPRAVAFYARLIENAAGH